jgi:hypothetical protein
VTTRVPSSLGMLVSAMTLMPRRSATSIERRSSAFVTHPTRSSPIVVNAWFKVGDADVGGSLYGGWEGRAGDYGEFGETAKD